MGLRLPEICGKVFLSFWILALTNLSLSFGGHLYATVVLRLSKGVKPLVGPVWASVF